MIPHNRGKLILKCSFLSTTKMGRPKHSSPKTYRCIFYRLLKGPLCLKDWKSTGLKSRSTVHKALKYLESRGLVKRERVGRSKPYRLVTVADKLAEMPPISDLPSNWPTPDWPIMSEWLPLLTTKREWEKITREPPKEIRDWAKRILKQIRPSIELMGRYGTISSEDEDRKIIDQLYKAKPNQSLRELLTNWSRYKDGLICPECLDKGELVLAREDHETGEMICPRCGLVIDREPWIM